jgi:hypothetical protein
MVVDVRPGEAKPMNQPHQTEQQRFRWKSPSGIALLGFLAIAAFFLLTEHRAHLLGVLPYLLLALCPLMHNFHHGRSDHHGSDNSDQWRDKP